LSRLYEIKCLGAASWKAFNFSHKCAGNLRDSANTFLPPTYVISIFKHRAE